MQIGTTIVGATNMMTGCEEAAVAVVVGMAMSMNVHRDLNNHNSKQLPR